MSLFEGIEKNEKMTGMHGKKKKKNCQRFDLIWMTFSSVFQDITKSIEKVRITEVKLVDVSMKKL